MKWTFAQMATARRIILKNAAQFVPDVVGGRTLTFADAEAILQTLMIAGVTFEDLVEQEREWEANRARYGRTR